MPSSHRRRTVGAALAVVVAIGVAGLGTASAARLDVGAASVAAGSAPVGDCQGDVRLRVELRSAAVGAAYQTDGVVVHGVAPDCVGQGMQVTLVNASGAALRTTSTVIVNAPGSQPVLTFNALPTSSVADARVLIHS